MTLAPFSGAARMDQFDIKEMISKGSFGVIYRVVHKGTGAVFALKQVQLKSMSRLERQEAMDEARTLAKLNHPFIIRHHDSFMADNDVLHILMDYAAGGTVYHAARQLPSKRLDEDRIWKHAIQTILGLNYIHAKRIIHRDIKSLNLFLDKHDNVKIGDFGIARALGDNTDMLRTIVGTPFYLSPELCEDKPYGEKTDVWAVGICLYELCMGKHPFTAQNEGALVRKILRGTYPPPSGYSVALLDLIHTCLKFDQSKRPTTTALLARPEVVAKACTLGIPLDQETLLRHAQPGENLSAQNTRSHEDDERARCAVDVAQEALRRHSDVAQPAESHFSHPPASTGHPFMAQVNGQAPAARAPPANDAGLPCERNYGAEHLAAVQQTAGLPCAPRHNHLFATEAATAGAHGLAQDIPRMAIGRSEVQRAHRAAQDAMNANVHACMVDNVKAMLLVHPDAHPTPSPRRPRPEALPAAGARTPRQHEGAPYGRFDAENAAAELPKSMAKEQEEAVWTHAYARPQYARKRCPDIMITGPSMRGLTATNARAPQAQGVYAYEGSVTTTTTYCRPTNL